MKELGKIIFYLVATVLLGALLAYPLYLGAQFLASHGIQEWMAELPFRKFFHRGLLVAAVVLLWPTAKWLNIPSVQSLGITPNPLRKQDLLVGFLASFLVMALLAAILIAMDIYRVRDPIRWVGLGKVLVSAVAVSFLEEWLFRGALLGLVLRAMKPIPALFSISALFSILHFLKPQESLPADHVVGWFSGFALIPGAFAQFEEPWLVLGGFLTLFLVGWILGWTRLRTGSLWMAIGLHIGWVIGKMGLGQVARRRKKDLLPWLGEDITIGLVSVAMVAITGVLIWLWITRWRKKDALAPASANGEIAG